MIQKLILLLAVLLFSSSLFGQLYEVDFNKKTRNSTYIVEGEVIKSESYYGSDNEIYTANEILVYKTFKGNDVPERLTVITLGGTVENEMTTWTHLLELSLGEAGVFFLEPSKRPKPHQLDFPQNLFNVYASSQGFLKYIFDDGRISAFAPFEYYPDVAVDLYEAFRQEAGIPTIYLTPEWEGEEKCITYLFEISQPNPQSFLELEALVSVKSTQGQFYLHKSSIIAEYNSDVLGESIIQNGALETEDSGISISPYYTVNALDLTTNQVKIEVVTNATDESSMYLIGDNYSSLIKLKLTLQELADPGILLDETQMTYNSEYFNPDTERPERFECIRIEGDFEVKVACSPPVITSFTTSYLPPDTIRAGTQDTLTIRGMCFDTIKGTSEVEFTDANTGPMPVNWVAPLDGDYVIWSDTLIKVLVPSLTKTGVPNSAGTGRFRVNRGASGTATSASDLYIPFAAFNHATGAFSNPANKSLKVYVPDRNGLGGQSIYYASNFKADTNAVKAFERGLENWRCATFINYRVQDSTAVPNILHAGRIEYDSLPVGAITTLASTGNPTFFCPDSTGFIPGSERRRFTIKFNSILNWHTDTLMPIPLPANTYDLESRAVHELGHAHLLNHSNNTNDLMYYTDVIPPLEYRRDIKPNDESGGNYIVQISTNPPASCPTAMTPLTPANCGGTTSVIDFGNSRTIAVTIYPNPTNNEFHVLIDDQNLNSVFDFEMHLFDVVGQKVLSKSINDNDTVIDVSILSSGIYLLTLSHQRKIIHSYKIIKN
jgi:hypothetical protein